MVHVAAVLAVRMSWVDMFSRHFSRQSNGDETDRDSKNTDAMTGRPSNVSWSEIQKDAHIVTWIRSLYDEIRDRDAVVFDWRQMS